MDEGFETLVVLFQDAAAAHHAAFAATDGYDPDWPRWYAEYLEPRLGALGWRVEANALADELHRADAAHRASGGEGPWPRFYARWFIEKQRT